MAGSHGDMSATVALCAPDSFKGCLTAAEAADAMARGVESIGAAIQAVRCPIADGGDGTLDALVAAQGGTIRRANVTGPRGETVSARWGWIEHDRMAVIELAEASGLTLIEPEDRDPEATTTYGTGQLIAQAIRAGAKRIIIGVGGSATCDGGAGLAQALGGRFRGSNGRVIDEPLTGGRLSQITGFEPPTDLPEILVACDVTNPLCGPNGAAPVYGPQKGATPEQVQRLDANLAHLASIVGGDMNQKGCGAAGGAGYGLMAMCRARLCRGIELVLDIIGFDERCRGADVVLTGEGRLDEQSLQGKACMGVAAAADRLGIPTIAIVGSTGPGAELCTDRGAGGMLDAYISLADRFSLDRAQREAAALLAQVARDVAEQRLIESR